MLEVTAEKPQGINMKPTALLKTREMSGKEEKGKGQRKCVLHKDEQSCFCTASTLSGIT